MPIALKLHELDHITMLFLLWISLPSRKLIPSSSRGKIFTLSHSLSFFSMPTTPLGATSISLTVSSKPNNAVSKVKRCWCKRSYHRSLTSLYFKTSIAYVSLTVCQDLSFSVKSTFDTLPRTCGLDSTQWTLIRFDIWQVFSGRLLDSGMVPSNEGFHLLVPWQAVAWWFLVRGTCGPFSC